MFYRKKGFTLLELMIVVIIVGILASLAMPRFIKAANKAREAEALSALGAIRSSQLRYYMEHTEYYASGADITGLDVSMQISDYYTYVGADGSATPTYVAGAETSTSGLTNVGIKIDGDIVKNVAAW